MRTGTFPDLLMDRSPTPQRVSTTKKILTKYRQDDYINMLIEHSIIYRHI